MSENQRDPRVDGAAEKSEAPVPAGMGVPMEEDVIGSVDAYVPSAAGPRRPGGPTTPPPTTPPATAGEPQPSGDGGGKRGGSVAKRVLAVVIVLAFVGVLVFGSLFANRGAGAGTGTGAGSGDDAQLTAEEQEQAAEREEAAAEVSEQKGERPLVLVVVGFDGSEGGEGAYPYRSDYDWHRLAFEDASGVSAYYTGQSNGDFTWVPAAEKSAYGTDGNTCVADAANDGVVHVSLPRAHGHWFAADNTELTADEASEELADSDFDQCVRDAIVAASRYVDLGSYDKDGDALLGNTELGVGIIMAGFERDGDWMALLDDGEFPRMQAHAKWFGSAGRKSGLSAFPKDTIVMGEQSTRVPDSRLEDAEVDRSVMGVEPNSLGTLCHELGHNLGLPDMYDIEYLEEGAWWGWTPGYLSLMDIGALARVPAGNDTFQPYASSLDPYSLTRLGWAQTTAVGESGTYEVRAAGTVGGKSVLRVESGTPGEYFLIENRECSGQDRGLLDAYQDQSLGTGTAPDGSTARGGIVVWHVDERVYKERVADNDINVPTHRPAITVQYLMSPSWEDPTSAHTLDFAAEESPDMEAAFWSASLARMRYEELGVDSFQLWRFGEGGSADDANARQYVNVRLDFSDEPGPVMHVRIDLAA